MWTDERSKELDMMEILGLAGGIPEEDLVLEETPDTFYAIARKLEKPVTPPDLSAELPSLRRILNKSAAEKSRLVVKTEKGEIFYIVWGIVVCGRDEAVKVTHTIKL